MVTRVRPGQDGTWQAVLGQGAAAFGRDGFASRAAAEEWGRHAAAAIRPSTVRIGSKRFLGTAAEALRRWAIDQGTLPRAEGGTQVAPVRRLAPFISDPDCALPLAALTPTDLAALRARRHALQGGAAMLAEQAALAAALAQFREFHLPAWESPLAEEAPDGLCVLEEADCGQAIACAGQMGESWERLVGLVLTTGLSVPVLLGCRQGQANAGTGRLHLPCGLVLTPPPEWLPGPGGDPAGPLLPGLGGPVAIAAGIAGIGLRLGRPGLCPEALHLTGMAHLLGRGLHLDEILPLAAAGAAPLVLAA